jgi:hypothetical protein
MFNFVGKYLVGTKLLKKAIEEVLMEEQLLHPYNPYDIYGGDNLAWREGDKWYGWTYSHETNKYFFDDMGDESLIALWERQWEWEDKQCQS